MNDGSALTGTHTFTNNSAVVQGSANTVYKAEISVGDTIISNGGKSYKVLDIQPPRVVATSAVTTSANSITMTSHGYAANQEVTYNKGAGTKIAGLNDGQIYFIKAVTNANTFTLSETAGGAVVGLTGTGNNAQNFVGKTNTGMTLTTAADGTESGVAATKTRPPVGFETNTYGVSGAESISGIDNVTSAVSTLEGTCHVSAPTVTVAAPTGRVLATSTVTTGTSTITLANHNMQTGTKVTYTHEGGTALAGLANATAYFVISTGVNTFKLGSSLSNANAGTAINLTGTGNNAQKLTGDTAAITAVVSSGKVKSYTVTNVGSDYQSAPTFTVAAPAAETLDLTDGAVAVVADNEYVVSANFYAAVETGDLVTYTNGSGGTDIAGLTDATAFFIIKSATTNRISLATTLVNANAGTKIVISAVAGGGTAHKLTGVTSTGIANLGLGGTVANMSREISHVGWVQKTVGTGGRAGRVQYETLVAASSMSGDGEDIVTPENV